MMGGRPSVVESKVHRIIHNSIHPWLNTNGTRVRAGTRTRVELDARGRVVRKLTC